MTDKEIQILTLFLTFLGGITSGVWGPVLLAKVQGKSKKEEIKLEGDSKVEELYVAATEKQYERYEAEIARIENSFNRRIGEMEKDFDRKFKELNKKYNHLLEEKSFLEKEIEIRDDRIDELEGIIVSKDEIISMLNKRIIN